MKVTCDTKPLVKQLKQLRVDVENKLLNMVESAAAKLAETAANNTPLGDADALENRPGYAFYYKQRANRWRIAEEVGFHQGSWVYTEGSANFDPTINTIQTVVLGVQAEARLNYKLGETFYIASNAPGNRLLENGYSPKAPDGIGKPTVDEIIQVYKINLQYYYK